MKIENGKMYAGDGKVVHRLGTMDYGIEFNLMPGEDELDFEEVDRYPTLEESDRMSQEGGYEEAVDGLIRKRYSVSQELAILRQRDTKPEEYAKYNEYAEQCKNKIKKLWQQK